MTAPGGSAVRSLVVKFLGDATGLQKTVDEVNKAAGTVGPAGDKAQSKWSTNMAKIGAAAAAASVVVGGAMLKFGKDSVDAFMEAEQSQAQFNDQIARIPGYTKEAQASLEDYASALSQKTVYDDDATKAAMGTLASFGLTADQIRTMTPLVQDYATKTGKDLVTAATDLGKAGDGQAKALKAIGINFKATGDDAADFATITGLLQEKVGGLAENMGGTTAGKIAILKNQFGEVQETVGAALVPVLTKLANVLITVVNWIQENSSWLMPLAGIIGAVVVAIWLATAAMAAFTIVSSPITLIIAGIVIAIIALTAGIVYLWKNCETFRDIVTAAFQVIGAVASWLWNNILWPIIQLWLLQFKLMWLAVQFLADVVVDAFRVIATVITWAWGIIQNVAGWISDAWGRVAGAAQTVARLVSDAWHAIGQGMQDAWDWVNRLIGDLVNRVRQLPQDVAAAGAGMWDWLTGGFRTAWNTVVGWWNGIHFPTIHIGEVDLGPLGKFGGASFGGWSVPQLPMLDRGGIVSGPTLAMLAMNSKPEAIIPLSQLGSGSTVIELNVNVPATANPAETGRAVANVLRSFVAAGGRIPVNPS